MKEMNRWKGVETRRLYQAKKWVSYSKVTFHQGMEEIYQTDYISSAKQMIPD